MTSLLREEIPVPMAEAASATTTACPASAAARATASPTTPAPTTNTCIRPAPLTDVTTSSGPGIARRKTRVNALMSQPSTFLLQQRKQDVDARHKAGHDDEGLPPASQLDRKAGVVLGHRAHSGLGARHIVELGELALAVEGIVARIAMKQLGHPPGEALRLPHPPQGRPP